MKRLFTIGLMLASAFALTNCSQELADPGLLTDQVTQEGVNSPDSSTGVPFKIYASVESDADTKTQVYKEGNTLKTRWVEGDEIIAVYEKNGTFSKPIVFTIDPQELEDGVFTGEVPVEVASDESKFNWYFTYGATVDEDNKGVAIISIDHLPTLNTADGSELAHIGGIDCPMYGQALNISGTIFPRVQMKHLATLHEVTVRNDTKANAVSGAQPGDIVLYSFDVSTSTAGSWDKANRISLAGRFRLDLKNGTIKNYGSGSGVDQISLTLPQTGVRIKPKSDDNQENEHKFYFVTAPIDNLQIGATYSDYYLTSNPTQIITADAYNALSEADKKNYTGNTVIRKDELNFIINKSVRPTLTDKTFDNFISGKVKKFIVPIKEMQAPLASDAVNIITQGRNGNSANELTAAKNLVTVGKGNSVTTSITVNGSSDVQAYVLDQSAVENNSDKIIIRGFVKDMINALPIGFYASQWNNTPTAMTISSMNLWLPEYDCGFLNLGSPKPHKYEGRAQINSYSFVSLASSIIASMGLNLSDGIQREELVSFIDASNITFAGMPANGYQDETKGNNFVVMYEDATYKDININLINYFLKNKFSTTYDGTYYEASYEGLVAILNADISYSNGNLTYKAFGDYTAAQMKTFAENTANGIYYKILQVFDSKVSMGGTLLTFLVKSPTHFMHVLRDMEVELIISTYPYTGTQYSPIVFWGLDAAN